MNKPNWKDAPEWANYLAMDKDGTWWWYEKEPELEEGEWWAPGKAESAKSGRHYWPKTLERRP